MRTPCEKIQGFDMLRADTTGAEKSVRTIISGTFRQENQDTLPLTELLHHLNVRPSGHPSHGWGKKNQKIVKTLSKSVYPLSKPI